MFSQNLKLKHQIINFASADILFKLLLQHLPAEVVSLQRTPNSSAPLAHLPNACDFLIFFVSSADLVGVFQLSMLISKL